MTSPRRCCTSRRGSARARAPATCSTSTEACPRPTRAECSSPVRSFDLVAAEDRHDPAADEADPLDRDLQAAVEQLSGEDRDVGDRVQVQLGSDAGKDRRLDVGDVDLVAPGGQAAAEAARTLRALGMELAPGGIEREGGAQD